MNTAVARKCRIVNMLNSGYAWVCCLSLTVKPVRPCLTAAWCECRHRSYAGSCVRLIYNSSIRKSAFKDFWKSCLSATEFLFQGEILLRQRSSWPLLRECDIPALPVGVVLVLNRVAWEWCLKIISGASLLSNACLGPSHTCRQNTCGFWELRARKMPVGEGAPVTALLLEHSPGSGSFTSSSLSKITGMHLLPERRLQDRVLHLCSASENFFPSNYT